MKKLLCIMLIVLMVLPLKTISIFAQDDEEENIEESNEILEACSPTTVWQTRKLTGFLDEQSFYISRFTNSETGETGFCVEPGINFEPCDGGYILTTYNVPGNELIGKISYAFVKLGASDDLYVAAQLMIWEALGSHYTINGDNGYAYGRSLIENYIKTHFESLIPSFKDHYSYDFGESVTLIDENNSLKYYKITSEGIEDLIVEGNKITFTMSNTEPFVKTIHFKPKFSYKSIISASSMLYYSQTSQNVYSFSGSFPIECLPLDLSISGPTGDVEFTKLDEWSRSVDERIELRIFSANDEEIINDNGWWIVDGKLLIENYLPVGDYYAIEKNTANYKPNDNRISFSVTKDEKNEITIFNINNDIDISYSKKNLANEDIEGSVFRLYDLDSSGNDIRFIKKGHDFELSELFPEDAVISQRYDVYRNDGLFKPMEIGICNYKDGSKNEFYIVSDNNVFLNNMSINILNGELLFEGKSLHNYIRTVDYSDHNKPISTDIDIYSEDGSFIRHAKTNAFGLSDISDLPDGNYVYEDGTANHSIQKKSGINTIYNLKSDRNYLLCEISPANGYQYHGEACQLINTKDYIPKTYEFINESRMVDVKVIKHDKTGKLLSGAVFEVETIFPDGTSLSKQYVSGGVVIENYGKDIQIMGDEDKVISSHNDYEILTDLKEGDYIYNLLGEKNGQTFSFNIKKGCFSILNIPFGAKLRIKELKAPDGYRIDDSELFIGPDIDYDDLIFEVDRINDFLIIPPDYDVPELCTID